MTPEEKKASITAKLKQPTTPIITQVVRVEPAKKKVVKEETETLSVKIPASLAKKLRQHRVDTKMNATETAIAALNLYFAKK